VNTQLARTSDPVTLVSTGGWPIHSRKRSWGVNKQLARTRSDPVKIDLFTAEEEFG